MLHVNVTPTAWREAKVRHTQTWAEVRANRKRHPWPARRYGPGGQKKAFANYYRPTRF